MTAGPYTCSHVAVVRRSMGTNSGSFSGRTHSGHSPGPQTDSNPSRPGSGALDSEHRGAMPSAPAVLSQLQDGAWPVPTVVPTEVLREVLTQLANTLRDEGALDEH